jgi:hypothetical protein
VTKFKVGDLVEITSKQYLASIVGRPAIIIRINNEWPENHILHLHTIFVNNTEVFAHPNELKLIE